MYYNQMLLLDCSGALTTVTTTSVRKALTVMLSFLVFPKPVNTTYLWGVFFVLAGLAVNIWIKSQSKKEKEENIYPKDALPKDGTLNV